MSDTNIVVLKGRLARSAELRTLTNGTPCTSFVLAVGESRKDSSTGAWENVPHFFDVTTFSNYAKAVIASLTQGQEVLVTGRLQQNRWEKNGQKFFAVRVEVHDEDFVAVGTKPFGEEDVQCRLSCSAFAVCDCDVHLRTP